MESLIVSLLFVALALTMSPTVQVEGSSFASQGGTTSNTCSNNQCSDLQRKQVELDSRIHQLETTISELTDINPRQDMTTAQPDITAQQDVVEKPQVYRDCEDARRRGVTTSGVYTIAIDLDNSFEVFCEQRLDGGGWVVFQSRNNGSVDFFRTWNAYKVGFGDLHGEFWLGNGKIHALSKDLDQQLKVELMSPEGEVLFADYSNFSITDQTDRFRLSVSGYSGGDPPGDALIHHNGKRFSAHDQDNDSYPSEHCAELYRGGWWYSKCHDSNLNGLYGSTANGRGLNWKQWKGYKVSMRATHMMVRRRP